MPHFTSPMLVGQSFSKVGRALVFKLKGLEFESLVLILKTCYIRLLYNCSYLLLQVLGNHPNYPKIRKEILEKARASLRV